MRSPLHITLGDSVAGCLRCWEEGRIIGAPIDRYAPLLMDACATSWAPAPRVVGTAMGRCGERNSTSDLFFSSRLQILIDAGRIEANGARDRLREVATRIAPWGISQSALINTFEFRR